MSKYDSTDIERVGSTSERLKKLPYEKRVCRIEHYPKTLSKMPQPDRMLDNSNKPLTIEQEVNAISDSGTEVWVTHSSRGRGIPLWPSKMLETPADADPDPISKFINLAHRKDIIVLTYYPFIFTKLLSKIHPEWMIKMLDDGGEEVWNEGWFCWNSPYRDWLPQYLNEMLDYFDFDGIYFDDMNWGSHSDTGQRRTGGCHCQYCREMYLNQTGKELSPKVQMDSIDFRQYVNWRYARFKDGVEHVAKGVYSKHPDAIIDWNYYGRPYGPDDIGWKSAHPLNPLDHSTYFFMEAGLDNLGASFPAKLLRAADSTFGLWLWATQMAPECASHSAPYPEPYTATVYGLSAVVRGGASVTTCLDAGNHTFYGDTLKSVFTELKKLSPFVGGESVKYLALHVSQQNRDFGYIDSIDDFWRLMRGSHEMLKRSQVLTEIVFDEQLTFENLSQYKVLFMSNSICLSDEQMEHVKRFVSEGGTLIATHETSLYDGLGRKRDNFGLADVFGVDYQGLFQNASKGTIESKTSGSVNTDHSNIYIPQKESLRNELGQIVAFGAALSRVSLRPGNETEVIFTKSNLKWKDEQPPLNDFHEGADSGEPAVTVTTFGKGKAIYICGDVGEGYDSAPLPQVKRFIAHLALSAHPPVEVDAPKVIDISAFMRAPNEMMIHLLNNQLPYIPWDTDSVDRRKYFYIDELLPVHDVVIKLNGFKVKNASLPFQNKQLDIDRDHDTITVPVVNIQEVVLLDIDN